MKRHLAFLALGLLVVVSASLAQATCPNVNCTNSAATYLVRTSCGTLANCFESVELMTGASNPGCLINVQTPSVTEGTYVLDGVSCTTNGWLWRERQPSSSNPVKIDVGPGTFGPFVCPDGKGFVTIRGAGREASRFRGTGTSSAGMDLFGCHHVEVSELTAEGNSIGVRWSGAGEGEWRRVDMIGNKEISGGNGTAAGWSDQCYAGFSGTTPSEHFIYESRSIATGGTGSNQASYGYLSNCAETYYYGGEILNKMKGGTGSQFGLGVGSFQSPATPRPSFFLYGTKVVSQPVDQPTGATVTVGIDVNFGSSVHADGASVWANAATIGTVNAIGLRTGGNSSVERVETPIEAAAGGAGTAVAVQNN